MTGSSSEQDGVTDAVLLADLSIREIRRLKKRDLQDLAQASNVSDAGTRKDLLARILAAKRGGLEKFVPGGTICPVCRKATMRVKSTGDVKRYFKCNNDDCGYKPPGYPR